EVMFRTVGAVADLQPALDALAPRVSLETLLEVPAVRLTTVDGFKTMSFPFATDVPFLDAWGKPLLFGPGSILVAHTDTEHVSIDELEKASDSYQTLARRLLAEGIHRFHRFTQIYFLCSPICEIGGICGFTCSRSSCRRAVKIAGRRARSF